jgi:hypothetical protein
MPAHMRKQIRDAAATALTGLATTETRVYPSRNHRTRPDDLPCLMIFTKDEESAPDNMSRPRDLERACEVVVVGRAKDNSTLDDTLDLIAAEVEAALGNNLLSDLASELFLARTEQIYDPDGEAEYGDVVLTWQAEYRTAENDATAGT